METSEFNGFDPDGPDASNIFGHSWVSTVLALCLDKPPSWTMVLIASGLVGFAGNRTGQSSCWSGCSGGDRRNGFSLASIRQRASGEVLTTCAIGGLGKGLFAAATFGTGVGIRLSSSLFCEEVANWPSHQSVVLIIVRYELSLYLERQFQDQVSLLTSLPSWNEGRHQPHG